MKHFLITRFNLKNEQWKQTKSGQDIITEEWLNERFRLFETFCLPSVKNQTNQKFYWCILFDIQTPSIYKEKIEHLVMNNNSNNNIYPLYIDGFRSMKYSMIKFIDSKLNQNDKYIITTRLDNDDIIHKNFIATIQSMSIETDKNIIDLTKGYQLIMGNQHTDFRAYTLLNNPFISIVESVPGFQTVISKNHNDWECLPKKTFYDKSPMWIQLIHKDNLINHRIKALKKVSDIDLKDFGLDEMRLHIGNRYVTVYNILMTPYRIYYRSKIQLKKIFFNK